jgi:hypothetical protein
MKAMSVLALAAMGVASVVEAQTATSQSPAGQKTKAQVQAPVPTGPDGSFKDECGFRYNSRGDRIDAQGRVLPPPPTPPGAGSCR